MDLKHKRRQEFWTAESQWGWLWPAGFRQVVSRKWKVSPFTLFLPALWKAGESRGQACIVAKLVATPSEIATLQA